jgi:uncharacterized membrane protein
LNSETRWRFLGKTLSYRVVVVALLAVITYALTGNPGEATMITILFNTGAAVIYYGFERLWCSISWGVRGLEGSPPEGMTPAFRKATYKHNAKQAS